MAFSRAQPDEQQLASDLADMGLTYSRGFSSGFLGGSDHQTLVEGRFPKHRGLYLGRVRSVSGKEVLVTTDERPWTGALGLGDERPEAPTGPRASALPGEPTPAAVELRPGMGVVFDASAPEDKHEPGGPIFRVERRGAGWVLGFGHPGPDLGRVSPGQRVWLNSDPALGRRTEALLSQGEPEGRLALTLQVSGAEGSGLRVQASAGGHEVVAASPTPLAPAKGKGLDEALLRDKLGAFGGTPFRLARLELGELAPGLHLPVSELKALRRDVLAALATEVERGPRRTVVETPVLGAVRASLRSRVPESPLESAARLMPLCRTDAQLEAVHRRGRCARSSWTGWSWSGSQRRSSARARPALRVDDRDGARAEAGRGGLSTRTSRGSSPTRCSCATGAR